MNYSSEKVKNQDLVLSIIIEPMMELMAEPRHVQGQPEAIKRLANQYVTALSGYSEDVLREAWSAVTANQKGWSWPAIGVICEACRTARDRHSPPAETKSTPPHARRHHDATRLAEQYIRDVFVHSPTYQQARTEGWNLGLMDYARESAGVQAHLISGSQGVGVDWSTAAGYPCDGWEQRKRDFVAQTSSAKARGDIRVEVPTWVIDTAKARAARFARKAAA